MPELKINISETTHQTLLTLAETSGETFQTILEQAVENYRRSLFLMQANQAFAALRENQALWQEELAERQEWEQTLADGVEEE
jgi:hypothetical protein